MSFPDALLLAMASALALTCWWNVTAGALAAQYFFLRGIWWAFGIEFPTDVQFIVDLTVVAAIYAKPPACYVPYRGTWHQVRALWDEKTLWDRVVLSCFPVMWMGYQASGNLQWWILYWAAIAQYVAAGSESLQSYLSSRSAKAGSEKPKHIGLEFTMGREKWASG